MTQPCIITVAITGAVPRKKDNPAVPVTPAEQTPRPPPLDAAGRKDSRGQEDAEEQVNDQCAARRRGIDCLAAEDIAGGEPGSLDQNEPEDDPSHGGVADGWPHEGAPCAIGIGRTHCDSCRRISAQPSVTIATSARIAQPAPSTSESR